MTNIVIQFWKIQIGSEWAYSPLEILFNLKMDCLISDIDRKIHINHIMVFGYQCVYYQSEANRSELYGTDISFQLYLADWNDYTVDTEIWKWW